MNEKPIYRRLPHGFVPVNEPAQEFFNKTKPGALVTLISKRGRNLGFHRKAFKLLRIAFDNQDKYDTMEQLRIALTIGAGFVKRIELTDGTVVLIPESWAFNNKEMTAERFEKLYSSLINQALVILPDWMEADLRQAVEREMVGFA